VAPRFTVLLPTHNRADVLGLAIASVLAQSEPDFELLIVADGCTDGTSDVVASFSDPRIRFLDLPKAPHLGYANRNVALREASGRLVAYAPHDDLLLPDHLALMGGLLERPAAQWGYSRPLWVSTDGIIVPFCTDLTNADELQVFMTGQNTIPACCVVHTRTILEQVGYWPEDVPFAADCVLWRRMLGSSGGVAAYHRQPTSLHFSADWKQSRFAGSSEAGNLLSIADSAAWWPAILRHPPAAEPEQATIWRAMRSAKAPWVASLRRATDTVINRVCWMAVREFLPAMERTAAELAQAKLDAEVDRATSAALRDVVVQLSRAIIPGPLHGCIDHIEAPRKVMGWAQDQNHPELPVLLEVLLADQVIGTVLACDYRTDLFEAGIGKGRCSFVFHSPVDLLPEAMADVRIRRSSDAVEITISPDFKAQLNHASGDGTKASGSQQA
jgi:hypothetical protein